MYNKNLLMSTLLLLLLKRAPLHKSVFPLNALKLKNAPSAYSSKYSSAVEKSVSDHSTKRNKLFFEFFFLIQNYQASTSS